MPMAGAYSREHCPRVYAIRRPELGWAQTTLFPTLLWVCDQSRKLTAKWCKLSLMLCMFTCQHAKNINIQKICNMQKFSTCKNVNMHVDYYYMLPPCWHAFVFKHAYQQSNMSKKRMLNFNIQALFLMHLSTDACHAGKKVGPIQRERRSWPFETFRFRDLSSS